jgi:two-component system, cell cycle sensor histidine kinase and response regulator CckA
LRATEGQTYAAPEAADRTDLQMKDSQLWILDDLPVGVWVGQAPDGNGIYSNRAFEQIHGKRVVTDVGFRDIPTTYGVHDAIGNAYPVERLPFVRALATGMRTAADDLVVHRADGVKVPIRVVAQPVKDAVGTVTHVIVAFNDITSEARARKDQAEFEKRLKIVVDHAPVVCWSTDRNGIITLSEGAGLGALGVKPGQLVGQSVFDIYRDYPNILEQMRRGLAGEQFWYTVSVGSAVYETWMTPVRDADGELAGILAVSNDVSEIRKLQAHTIQTDRVMALGTLAASVAHEINNPLTYVLSYLDEVEALLGELGGGKLVDRARIALEPVKKGVERIATITRDLRTFSRPDDVRLEPLELGAVVESVLKLLRKEIEARAELVLSLEETRAVLGNEARLVQVVLNLVMNAIQALPEDRPSEHRITVSVHDENEWVVVEVSDSGPGVKLEDRERIFDPFVTTKPVGVGTGLGLFVCRNVVRGLGGEVTVGDRPGGGASFRVLLPVGKDSRRHEGDARRAPALRDARVLIIEDDSLVARSFADRLRVEGIAVEVAPGAKQGLELLSGGGAFDVIYCDLMMKELTGMDFADAIDARSPELRARVVFMTGGAFTPRAAAFVEENADRVVDKPFDIMADLARRLSPERA